MEKEKYMVVKIDGYSIWLVGEDHEKGFIVDSGYPTMERAVRHAEKLNESCQD